MVRLLEKKIHVVTLGWFLCGAKLLTPSVRNLKEKNPKRMCGFKYFCELPFSLSLLAMMGSLRYMVYVFVS